MPLGDIAVGFLEIVVRFIGQFFLEVILEIFIKGPGYLIVKLLSFSKKKTDPDSFLAIIAGLLFWVIIGYGAFLVYSIVE